MKKTTIYMSLLALIFAASSCTKGCNKEHKAEEPPVAAEAPADKAAEEPAKEEAPAQPEGHEHEGHDGHDKGEAKPEE